MSVVICSVPGLQGGEGDDNQGGPEQGNRPARQYHRGFRTRFRPRFVRHWSQVRPLWTRVCSQIVSGASSPKASFCLPQGPTSSQTGEGRRGGQGEPGRRRWSEPTATPAAFPSELPPQTSTNWWQTRPGKQGGQDRRWPIRRENVRSRGPAGWGWVGRNLPAGTYHHLPSSGWVWPCRSAFCDTDEHFPQFFSFSAVFLSTRRNIKQDLSNKDLTWRHHKLAPCIWPDYHQLPAESMQTCFFSIIFMWQLQNILGKQQMFF